jgi:ATP-dependent protease ClpP protease subunit
MAKKYDIDIDGFIGSWFSSKRHVKDSLKGLGEKEITVRVNSMGGILDDAIDISAQFAAHGKVTCELFALNASAATVLTLGANKVRMNDNGTYMIHKVLSWVDAWGYMNEDEIDAAIERLQAEKDRNSTQNLIIVRMYAKKSGKPVKDILDLMKAEKYLNAREALEWGFVDEIFEDSTTRPVNLRDPKMLNLLNAAGLPLPSGSTPGDSEKAPGETGWQGFLNELREIFIPQKNTVTMNKTFISINTLLNVEGIEFKNGKAELTESQVKLLNDALAASPGKPAEEKPADKNEKEPAKPAEEKPAKPDANNLSEKDLEIQALKEQIAALNKQPGAETGSVNRRTDTPPAEDDEMKEIGSARELYNLLP